MELDLRPHSPTPQVFTSSISVDNMSWWFWIKAGVGFVFGAWLCALALFIPTLLLYFWFIGAVLRAYLQLAR